jgi:hypothetical protein
MSAYLKQNFPCDMLCLLYSALQMTSLLLIWLTFQVRKSHEHHANLVQSFTCVIVVAVVAAAAVSVFVFVFEPTMEQAGLVQKYSPPSEMHLLTVSNLLLILLATATFLFLATPVLGGVAIFFKWIPEEWQARVSELMLDESVPSDTVDGAIKQAASWTSQPTTLMVEDDMKHDPEYVILRNQRCPAPQPP